MPLFVCRDTNEGSLYSSSMICTVVRLSPPLFFPTVPSFPYLMSENVFDSIDVSSGGYVNIYWHDSQQQREGGKLLHPTSQGTLKFFLTVCNR